MGELPQAVRLAWKEDEAHVRVAELLQCPVVAPTLTGRDVAVFGAEEDERRRADLIQSEERTLSKAAPKSTLPQSEIHSTSPAPAEDAWYRSGFRVVSSVERMAPLLQPWVAIDSGWTSPRVISWSTPLSMSGISRE